MSYGKLVLVILLTFLVSSCGHVSQTIPVYELTNALDEAPTNPHQQIATETNTLLPTATLYITKTPAFTLTPTPLSLTATPFTPTSTPSPSPTPTISSWMRLRTECLDILPELPADFRGAGNIVLWHMQGAEHSYSLDMETGAKSTMPDDWGWWEWSVSPGERWLAFQKDGEPHTIQIMNFKGIEQTVVRLEKDWGYSGWLDDEHLEIYKTIDREFKLYSLTTLNPFTREIQDFPVDYPDIYTLGVNFFPLAYDPTLTLLVYPYNTKEEMGFRLRDILGGRTLAIVLSSISNSGGPRWSPNGEQAIITGMPDYPDWSYFEFYSVSRNGKVTQLTDFEAHKAKISTVFDGYSWSPNNKYLAFWLTIDSDTVERLAVLDVSTHEVVNYCIPGEKPLGAYPPIWSPDSQQIVVGPNQGGPVIVIDIKQKKAAAIGMFLEPVLWLNSVPDVWISSKP